MAVQNNKSSFSRKKILYFFSGRRILLFGTTISELPSSDNNIAGFKKSFRGDANIKLSRTKLFDSEETVFDLPLLEFWVVSKLHGLIDAVTISYDKFFFGDVAREIYDFFWAEFADWYIEASKSRLYKSEVELKSLPYREQALIVSAWPVSSLPRIDESVKKFENLQTLTRAIRNAHAEYSVEPGRRIPASIVANPEVLNYIFKERDVLALLSRLDLHNVSFDESSPGDDNQSVHLVASEGLEAYLPLSAMVDISAEVQRLSKRLAKMQTEYDRLIARLSSPNFVEYVIHDQFVEKAPEDVVSGVREKAADAEEKLTFTRSQLSFL